MPTAARLIAAIVFAALGYLLSEMVKPLFPPGSDLGRLSELNAGVGLLVGWVVAGSRAGDGWRAAVGHGLTGAAAFVFWAMLLHASIEMIRRSMRSQYDGPISAVVGIFELIIGYGQVIATAGVIGVLVLGGVAAGLVAEYAARRWD